MKLVSAKRILAMLMVLCMLFSFAGCKKNPTGAGSSEVEIEYEYVYEEEEGTDADEQGTENSSTDTPATSTNNPSGKDPEVIDSEISGTISLGVSTQEAGEMKHILPIFKAKYPKIKVNIVEVGSSLLNITSKWTSMAAANKLPDVVIGSENFGLIMQQGWAYPLDNLLAKDKMKEDVLEMGLDRYRYEGKLYALPFRLQFNTMVFNKDLVEKLNIKGGKMPAYNWTTADYLEYTKAAVTPTTSGLNYIYNSSNSTYGFDNKLLSAYLPDGYHQYGFNFQSGQFDLYKNNAFVDSNNFINQLKAVPALISDDLKYTGGTPSDYEKRFGKGADAFVEGQVLTGNHNSWELHWILRQLKFDADVYPVPTATNVAQRIQTHVDFVFMNSKLKQNKADAAYALCRFLSYDVDGCNARIDYCVNKSEKDIGSIRPYYPATENKNVLANFKSQKLFPEGLKYMLNTVVNDPAHTLVADCDKVIPEFWSNVNEYKNKVDTKLKAGEKPESLVGDLQTKINASTKASLEHLSKQVKKNQDDFYASHTYEKK